VSLAHYGKLSLVNFRLRLGTECKGCGFGLRRGDQILPPSDITRVPLKVNYAMMAGR